MSFVTTTTVTHPDGTSVTVTTTPEAAPPAGDELTLSKLGFGCWQLASTGGEGDYWGMEYTQEMANTMLAAAIDAGICYVDTAQDYSKGASEEQLGVALKSLTAEQRAKVVLGTKIVPNLCSDIENTLNASLGRLQVDYVDLYQVHWPIDKNSMAHFANGHASFGHSGHVDEADVPPAVSAFVELGRMQALGKIKHVSVCNFGVEQLKQAQSTGVKIASNQVCYNLIWRAAELQGIVDYCREQGIKLIAYSALMQGILTCRYTSADDVPMYRARSRHFNTDRHAASRHGEPGCEELLFATLAKVKAISESSGLSCVQLALGYPLAKGFDCVIAGFTKDYHIESNSAAVATPLPAAVVASLDDATQELQLALGPNADLWQGVVDGVQTGRVR